MNKKISIFDLLTKRTIENFRTTFLNNVNMQISFADEEHNKYNTYYSQSRCAFCQLLNANPQTLNMCIESSRVGGKEAARNGKSLIYKCHAGLMEVVVPIIVEGEHIGGAFSGQIITQKPDKAQKAEVLDKLETIGLNRKDLEAAYDQIPIVTDSTLQLIVGLMSTIVDYIVETERNLILDENINIERKKMQEVTPCVINDFVGMLISGGKIESEKVIEKAKIIGLSTLPDTILYIKIDNFDILTSNQSERFSGKIRESIINTISADVALKKDAIHTLHEKDSILVLYNSGVEPNKEKRKAQALEFGERLRKAVQTNTAFTVTVGIGVAPESIGEFCHSYRESNFARFSGMLKGGNIVIHASDILAVNVQEGFGAINNDTLKNCILAADTVNVLNIFDELFRTMLLSPAFSIEKLKTLQIDLLNQILNVVEMQEILDDIPSQKIQYYNEIFELKYVEELYIWMRKAITQIIEKIETNKQTKNKLIIAKAKKYIDSHYKTNLSLDEVAATVYLSPNYFGWLFKKEIGSTYLDYLTYKRVEKAKHLLAGSGMSIQSIAREIGYNDPNYFSQVFLKQEKMRPSTYREMFRKNSDNDNKEMSNVVSIR
jgi:Response regulator containing CheY-like receiver domain and AraC-type DNA-binding domain